MGNEFFSDSLEHVRWFASKCARLSIVKASYAGWDVYTQPVSFNEVPSCGKVFSTSDIYLESLRGFREIVSESRIFINCKIEAKNDVRITAPYVSMRGMRQRKP